MDFLLFPDEEDDNQSGRLMSLMRLMKRPTRSGAPEDKSHNRNTKDMFLMRLMKRSGAPEDNSHNRNTKDLFLMRPMKRNPYISRPPGSDYSTFLVRTMR